MSVQPEPIGTIPTGPVRVARAAFPKGTVITRLRDDFSVLCQEEDFQRFYPACGRPGLAPGRLALVTVFQFLEHLSDRQAADAVRARIDWKYALGLELADPGFHFSVLTRSEEHTSELQSRQYLVCRLLLEKKKKQKPRFDPTN